MQYLVVERRNFIKGEVYKEWNQRACFVSVVSVCWWFCFSAEPWPTVMDCMMGETSSSAIALSQNTRNWLICWSISGSTPLNEQDTFKDLCSSKNKSIFVLHVITPLWMESRIIRHSLTCHPTSFPTDWKGQRNAIWATSRASSNNWFQSAIDDLEHGRSSHLPRDLTSCGFLFQLCSTTPHLTN